MPKKKVLPDWERPWVNTYHILYDYVGTTIYWKPVKCMFNVSMYLKNMAIKDFHFNTKFHHRRKISNYSWRYEKFIVAKVLTKKLLKIIYYVWWKTCLCSTFIINIDNKCNRFLIYIYIVFNNLSTRFLINWVMIIGVF